MKSVSLFSAAALYLTIGGLGFLFIPWTLEIGALGATPAVIVAELRQYGGALLGIVALNWVERNANLPKPKTAITWVIQSASVS